MVANEIIASGAARSSFQGCLHLLYLSLSLDALASYSDRKNGRNWEGEKKRESKIRKESERRRDSPKGSSRVYEGNCGKTCFADISLSTSRRWRGPTGWYCVSRSPTPRSSKTEHYENKWETKKSEKKLETLSWKKKLIILECWPKIIVNSHAYIFT